MLFVASIFLALIITIIAIIIMYHTNKKNIFLSCIPIIVLFGAYTITSPVTYFSRIKVDDMLKQYEKAKMELYLLESKEDLSLSILNDYIFDITMMNELIEDSRKYHDNLYLGPFYYKEVADLKLLDHKGTHVEINL